MLDQLWAAGGLEAGQKLAILGAAYKPDIDDPRESPAALLAAAARKRGLLVQVHDPLVKAGKHHGLTVSNDLPGTLQGATAATLLCEHRAYRCLSAKFFQEHLAGKLVADARNWLNHASLRRAGFTVVLLGVGTEQPPSETPARIS